MQKTKIAQQLLQWKEAALQMPALLEAAPNMKVFAIYAAKVVQATDIGLQALERSPDEKEKAEFLQILKALKGRGDVLEIQILPEIEALVTGTLSPLPASFSPF